MLRKLLTGACVIALAACASHPTTGASAAATTQQPLGCVSGATATRLATSASDCAGPGSVYSKGDIDRTGKPYLDQALRTLDPAITTHGGP